MIKFKTLTIFMLISASLTAQVNLSNGLIMYLPLNGNTKDSSGNLQHGTNYGASITSDRFGNSNSAFSFDGNNDYLSFPISNALTDYYSYSIWVNASEIPNSGNYTYPIAIGGTGGGSNIALTNNIMQGWAAGSYNNGTPSTSLVAIGSQPNVGQWYHVVLIRDTNKIKLYVNGELNTNEVSYNGFNSNTNGNKPTWGSLPAGSVGARLNANFFKGKIDDVRVYNRILNEEEIDSLYTQSNSTSLNRIVSNYKNLYIYPNPANNFIEFELDKSPVFGTKVEIINIFGETIQNDELNTPITRHSIDVSNIPAGVYYIKVYLDSEVYLSKFIKH